MVYSIQSHFQENFDELAPKSFGNKDESVPDGFLRNHHYNSLRKNDNNIGQLPTKYDRSYLLHYYEPMFLGNIQFRKCVQPRKTSVHS